MVVICLGPVCVPLYALLPLVWAVWYRVKSRVLAWWSGEPVPECEGGTCKMPAQGAGPEESKPLLPAGEAREWEHDTKAVRAVASEEDWKQLRAQAAEGRTLCVKFTATWCGPCKAIQPVYEALCAEANASANRVQFVTLDVDELEDAMKECGVAALPTFQIFRGESMLAQAVGGDETKLRALLQDNGVTA